MVHPHSSWLSQLLLWLVICWVLAPASIHNVFVFVTQSGHMHILCKMCIFCDNLAFFRLGKYRSCVTCMPGRADGWTVIWTRQRWLPNQGQKLVLWVQRCQWMERGKGERRISPAEGFSWTKQTRMTSDLHLTCRVGHKQGKRNIIKDEKGSKELMWQSRFSSKKDSWLQVWNSIYSLSNVYAKSHPQIRSI